MHCDTISRFKIICYVLVYLLSDLLINFYMFLSSSCTAQTGIYLSKRNPRCFMYVFAHNAEAGEHATISQSIHGEDLPFVFGAPLGEVGPFGTQFSAEERLLSEAMMRYISRTLRKLEILQFHGNIVSITSIRSIGIALMSIGKNSMRLIRIIYS